MYIFMYVNTYMLACHDHKPLAKGNTYIHLKQDLYIVIYIYTYSYVYVFKFNVYNFIYIYMKTCMFIYMFVPVEDFTSVSRSQTIGQR
jgi:hypothetical protein